MEDQIATIDRIAQHQAWVRTHHAGLKQPEPIKLTLVLPFIRMLGYDPHNPQDVTPQHQIDTVRVDYAIRDGDDPLIAFHLTSTPENPEAERNVAFMKACSEAGYPCAILTSGVRIGIYLRGSDGLMAAQPAIAADYSSERPVDPSGFEHLEPETFDMRALTAAADARRAREEIVRSIGDELADPTEAFAQAIAARLRSAGIEPPEDMQSLVAGITAPLISFVGAARGASSAQHGAPEHSGVQTEGDLTEEENLAFNIVKAIAARHLDPTRIVARPAKSYIAILKDDNNRRQIARIHFKTQSVKHLGTFVQDNDETKHKVSGANDIYGFENAIIERIKELAAQD